MRFIVEGIDEEMFKDTDETDFVLLQASYAVRDALHTVQVQQHGEIGDTVTFSKYNETSPFLDRMFRDGFYAVFHCFEMLHTILFQAGLEKTFNYVLEKCMWVHQNASGQNEAMDAKFNDAMVSLRECMENNTWECPEQFQSDEHSMQRYRDRQLEYIVKKRNERQGFKTWASYKHVLDFYHPSRLRYLLHNVNHSFDIDTFLKDLEDYMLHAFYTMRVDIDRDKNQLRVTEDVTKNDGKYFGFLKESLQWLRCAGLGSEHWEEIKEILQENLALCVKRRTILRKPLREVTKRVKGYVDALKRGLDTGVWM